MTGRRFEAFVLGPGASTGELTMLEIDGAAGSGQGLSLVVPELSPDSVRGLIRRLQEGADALVCRSVSDITEVLGRVGERFGDEADEVRREALALLPATAGVSDAMARAILDGMAADWTHKRLRALVAAEFEDPAALDGITAIRGREVMAVGPRLCVQIVSGSVPGVGVSALIRSLIVKAPTLLKPGLGDVVLPVLFARALRAEDEGIANALAVVYWPGGSTALEAAALAEADVVTVYGSDDTVASVRAAAPPTARVVGYHHRVSLGVIGREALASETVGDVAAHVARSVGMFDQRGCVCPQVIYVERSGATEPVGFAEVLAEALAELETRLPSGPLSPEEGAVLQQMRGNAELMAATGRATVFHGGDEASWSVISETDALPGASCLGRSVRVRPLRDATDLAGELGRLQGHLQTVAYAGLGERLSALAADWARMGVSRVAPFWDVSFPPPWWLHDGRGPLQELVRWVEIDRP
ncbi:MAG: hypothetical protein O2958_01540 [Gemmatimonadetes bacterium]|nr:hypothetical protein [Gemmatimonadota bacterium]MDA1102218.1 hypothetical protein [Gemmatimonadota bacterium]